MIVETVATVCLVWYLVVAVVCTLGYIQLCRWYSSPPRASISASKAAEAPHVTVIRPVKGLDTCLYQCLASTFHQTYPRERLTMYFCVPSRGDAAVPVLQKLIEDHADFDAKLFVETEDPCQRTPEWEAMGPNPKIRSMSRAYREAKGDIIWIMDCNVWINPGACGRMVDTLHGYGQARPNKFVHHLPLVVDLTDPASSESQSLLSGDPASSSSVAQSKSFWSYGGGRFEESWFSAAHVKFYTAINTVLIAPCIVGKSNMFRRSHLNALTECKGIDFFSHNICEDHLIGDLLWKRPVPPEILDAEEQQQQQQQQQDGAKSGRKWGNHALAFGDFAVQPVADMAVGEFFARRVRWLRVRKFTVIAATLVEPGTESILCSLYGAFAFTFLPFLGSSLGFPQSWSTFWSFWLVSMTLWVVVDRTLYRRLQTGASIEMDQDTPAFARFKRLRDLPSWLCAWIGRELLAFPIWAWAVYGGVTVSWRGKTFRVGMDMRVHEIRHGNCHSTTRSSSSERKARRD